MTAPRDADPMTLLAAPFAAAELPDPGPEGLLVLRARPSAAFAPGAFAAEQSFRPLHDALAAQGVRVWPELPADLPAFPAAAALATRSKAATRADFARAWARTRPGGAVLAAGLKTDGIESLQKALRALIPLDGVRPGGHGRVLWATRTEATPPAFADWIAEAAPAPRVILPDGAPMLTCAGAFSWTEVDPASALLAAAAPPLSGRVADLGAGWGFLARALLAAGPDIAALDLVEADHAVLACARANLADPRAAFHWADAGALGTPGAALPRGGHDWVVTNPPFHAGRAADPALGAAFIAAAGRLLRPSGRLLLVANRALPYERALAETFAEVERFAETPAFKLIRAARPRRPGR